MTSFPVQLAAKAGLDEVAWQDWSCRFAVLTNRSAQISLVGRIGARRGASAVGFEVRITSIRRTGGACRLSGRVRGT